MAIRPELPRPAGTGQAAREPTASRVLSQTRSAMESPMNKEVIQKPTNEQRNALITMSQMAFEAEVQRREQLASQYPHMSSLLSQKVKPESRCGCGCNQTVVGYFAFGSCGCGCSTPVSITGTPVTINDNNVTFQGVAYGDVSYPFNTPPVYLAGALNDVQNVVGITLNLNLSITPTSVTLSLYDDNRFIGTLMSSPAYYHGSGVQFSGNGTGVFRF
jgi:hypothetical protein